jgi:tRNA(fMet)-specific endonuclease VapC
VVYLLDTNTWVEIVRWKLPRLIARLELCATGEVVLCAVVVAELLFGATKSQGQKKVRNLADVQDLRNSYLSLPFDDDAAEHYADIRADLESKGTPIGPNDLLIAAIARANKATVVTDNLAEFQRVSGLLVESWQ